MEKPEAETEQDKKDDGQEQEGTRLKAESSKQWNRRDVSVSSNARRHSQPPARPSRNPAVYSDHTR